jgi:SAM-dependent methyltransferase
MKESTIDEVVLVVVVEEDDWSGIMLGRDPLSNGSFAQHDTLQVVMLPNGKTLHIASMASLSPLDMLDLSCGTCDATGHRVWLGAELWIQALPTLAPFFLMTTRSTTSSMCKCLELGSGTGLAGLAVLHFFDRENTSFDLTLTDNSESVLELCRANCRRNQLDSVASRSTARVEQLEWGSSLPEMELTQDIVMATDVIYDVASWRPLLETARRSVSSNGYLMVAHVPRAALPEEEFRENSTTTLYHQSLESYLIRIAWDEYCFRLRLLMRPSELDTFPGQQDMEDAGASILIFQRDTDEKDDATHCTKQDIIL